jgi:ring-1,2-phenylacetyl-CoA epoxidase subunit PaaC
MTETVISPVDVAQYALRLGDDALVLAQRLGEWSACAPELEEDVALSNIALDLLGQARHLLTIAGAREGQGRSEDDLAFLRDERQFVNLRIVEEPNGDFAQTIARLLVFSTYQHALYRELERSSDSDIAAVAAKAVKEVAYHRHHAVQWTLRLGVATEESHQRMRAGLEHVWPFTPELFQTDELTSGLVAQGVAADPAAVRETWEAFMAPVLAEATLDVPQAGARKPDGGRRGHHGEGLGFLLAELQWLHRSHPGASW